MKMWLEADKLKFYDCSNLPSYKTNTQVKDLHPPLKSNLFFARKLKFKQSKKEQKSAMLVMFSISKYLEYYKNNVSICIVWDQGKWLSNS